MQRAGESPGDATPGGPAAAGTGLTSHSVAGLGWGYLRIATASVLQVGFGAVTARLLAPSEFGLLAMASFALGFATWFGQMGVGQALVQMPHLSRDHVRAAFTLSVGFGLGTWAVVWFAAPFVASAFQTPQVVGVLRLAGASLALTGLHTTASHVVQRQLRFKATAIVEFAGFVVGYLVVGLTLAFLGAGVWSLVAAMLALHVVVAVGYYPLARHPLLPVLRRAPYGELLGYGGRVSVMRFLDFLSSNLDTFAVGRFAGAGSLGQYNRAFVLVNLPLSYGIATMSEVLFPGLARIQADRARVQRVYRGAMTVVAFVVLPVCAGIAAAAPELVAVLLGPQWGAVPGLLPVLSLAVALFTLSQLAGMVCEAHAALDAKLRLQVVHLVLLGVALYSVRGSPLWAYATVLAVAEAARHVGYLVVLRGVLGLRVRVLARCCVPGVGAAVAVAVAVTAARTAAGGLGAPAAVTLLVAVLAAAAGLASFLRFGPAAGVREELRLRLEGVELGGRLGPSAARARRVLLGAAPGDQS